MCQGFEARLSRYRFQKNDSSRAKVDAALYRTSDAPPGEGAPDWADIRLYIEFKKGGTELEPFDDEDPDHPEPSSDRRKAARAQLIAYTHNAFLYQHRDALYSLFVNGKAFRTLRWDRSGVIVTKRWNYVEDPRPLLEFLAYFERLSDVQQGIDCTATLLAPTSKAYKLMDYFAQANPSDMPHADKTEIMPFTQPSSTPAPPKSRVPDSESDEFSEARSVSSDAPTAPAAATYEGPAFGTRQRTKQAAQVLPNPSELIDILDLPELDESYLDEIEVSNGTPPRVFQYVRDKFRKSIDPKLGWPRYKLEVGEERRPFLVGEPIFFSTSMFGRGTRGYVALDVKARRFVFLKDSWRPFYIGVEPEGYYLQLLASGGSKPIDVPKLVTHGDVGDQHAFTALYAYQRYQAQRAELQNAPSVLPFAPDGDTLVPPEACPAVGKKRNFVEVENETTESTALPDTTNDDNAAEQESFSFRQYRHYRLVVQDVCLPFTSVTSSKQLVTMIYQCMITHQRAYNYHRVLHRDISAGNVIIRPHLEDVAGKPDVKRVVWAGVLTDWELAKVVPQEGEKEIARQPERTGTWQFMSVAYVEYHPTPVTVADEIESFFHATLFYAVRLLRHNIHNVPSFIMDYFDAYDPAAGKFGRTCSKTKTIAIKDGLCRCNGKDIAFSIGKDVPHKTLNTLLASWQAYFKARYEVLAWDDLKQTGEIHIVEDNIDEDSDVLEAPDFSLSPAATETHMSRNLEEKMEPSDEVRNLAKLLDRHDSILIDIYEALSGTNPLTRKTRKVHWPSGDVLPDKFSEVYDPREYLLAIDRLVAATIDTTGDAPPLKRIRTSASESMQPQAGSSKQHLSDADAPAKNPRSRSRKSRRRSSRGR
ncbi:hypothetical protein C8Q79DRAFT_987985 [Trametes meyenii]|nr:hypothetical protein C8Q79DRAFT_987985 [Trametes meyenii]